MTDLSVTRATPLRQILLRPDPIDGGFAVEVLPAIRDGIGHDRSFDREAQARDYAKRLAACLGLPLVDRIEV